MATKGTGFVIPFKVVVRSTGANAGDEHANLTCFLIADGVRAEATNAPTYAGANGWHLLEVTDAEAEADTLALDATCSTDDRFVQPVSYDLVTVPSVGSGQWPITLTVEDDSGDPVTGAILTFPGIAPQTTNTLGEFPSAWALDAGTYSATLAVGGGYTATNPVTVTVDASGNVTVPTGGVIEVVRATLPEATEPDYCAVSSLAGTESPTDPNGRFYVESITSPLTAPAGAFTERVVLGRDSEAYVDGLATLQLRREAVVTLVSAAGYSPEKRYVEVVIPDAASADVEDLESAE